MPVQAALFAWAGGSSLAPRGAGVAPVRGGTYFLCRGKESNCIARQVETGSQISGRRWIPVGCIAHHGVQTGEELMHAGNEGDFGLFAFRA